MERQRNKEEIKRRFEGVEPLKLLMNRNRKPKKAEAFEAKIKSKGPRSKGSKSKGVGSKGTGDKPVSFGEKVEPKLSSTPFDNINIEEFVDLFENFNSKSIFETNMW